MLRDAEFFKSRLGKLEGAAELGDYIVDIVKNKPVADAPKAVDTPQTEQKGDGKAEGEGKDGEKV